MESNKRPLPGIVCDIDGVLLRDKSALPFAADMVQLLKMPLRLLDPKQFPNIETPLPFVCLTNGGGLLETMKAKSLNYILDLNQREYKFDGKEILLNYTALRPVMSEYKDKLVIVSGVGDMEEIARDIGLKKYLTIEEYALMYPDMFPVTEKGQPDAVTQEARRKVAERIGITDFSIFDKPLQVHAVFLLNDPPFWYEYLQVICDLVASRDGSVPDHFPEDAPTEHIPVYTTNNDLVYSGKFSLPRLTSGAFNECLKHMYKQLYNKELQMEHYGKPFSVTYDYAKKHLSEYAKTELSNTYMIGDNPKSDIRGARAAGWKTILVESGVFKKKPGVENDPQDPADFVVKDISEAIKLICKLENINLPNIY